MTKRGLHFVLCNVLLKLFILPSDEGNNRKNSFEYKLPCQPIVIHFNEQSQIHQYTCWIINKLFPDLPKEKRS